MRWIVYPFMLLFVLAAVAAAALGTAVILAWPKLPSLESLTDYRPKVPLRVYTADGHLLGEFGEERRALVSINQVPVMLRQAILAAEDERFYEHPGIDFIGLARAAIANFASGERGQGASTITMQVARNFFLSREKTYNRKLYEVLLSLKIEQNLSKDQILELYINQIFLGQRAYGFASAARIYYDKELDEINLAEAAMLAGLPKAPSLYNPVSNERRAVQRQQYVLRRMLDAGFIDQAQFDEARDTPIRLARAARRTAAPAVENPVHGEYVAEMARQIAVEQFGEDAHNLGIRIITTVTMADQAAAYKALRDGVQAFDKRRGYRGPEAFVDLGSATTDPDRMDELMSEYRDFGDLLTALVIEASTKEVKVYRHGETIAISGKGLAFAAPMLADRAPQARRIRPGAVVRIRKGDDPAWELVQLPEVEAALIAVDANTGAVRALVGGFDFNRSKFNHVTQALRQAGSSFKPFIYSAALEKGFSPASYVDDEPLYFPAGVTGSKAWEPKNYDGKFDGSMTMRDALVRSKNMVSIRLLQSISPDYAQEYITRFGFEAQHHPAYLTMALGAGSATPWQMAGGYAVFANGGYKIEPYIVSEIIDGNGRTVAKVDPPVAGRTAPRVLDPRNAWLMDSMMRDVVNRGTAGRARSLGRNDLAGKTGTTNDYVDAWFAGYNPDLVAVSWMGYGQPRNMGRGETGGRAALPIWMDYMKVALEGAPQRDRPRPDGLLPVQHPDMKTPDYYYRENPPPAPLQPELPDIPELRYFMPDYTPSNDPSVNAPRDQAPAPVEERMLAPLRP
ncbi:MAG: penicillin-binding protein 1A [Rhodocyclaceae bacterium]|jgi:penicillin-binding protein 1A|nr:penicillin-binding protein 1A [Rhodocyclaceae bacterium]